MSESRESIIEFGRELINAREYKNMSIEQISEITKIDIKYLRAMEMGDWDLLPRPYMEAFLKAYAETVGMNVPKVMKKYREMVRYELLDRPELDGDEETALEKDHTEEIPELPHLGKRKVVIFAGILVIVILIIVLSIVFKSGDKEIEPAGDRQSTVPPSEQLGTQPETTQAQTETETPSREVDQSITSRSRDLTEAERKPVMGIVLQALAVETCWLQAIMDQDRVRDVLLSPGDKITLRASDEIHLVIGNAAGLELIMGEDTLKTLGPKAKPITMVIGPEGIKSQRLGAWHLNYNGEIEDKPIENERFDSVTSN